MKRRTSFVANSSSSSFIIGCSSIPETVEDAGTIWFGDSKDYVAPVITQGLFNGLNEFKLDLVLLLENAKNIKSISNFYPDTETCSNEDTILYELANTFEYEEKQGRRGYWSSDDPSEFEKYEKKELKKLLKKFPEAKHEYDIPYSERTLIADRWFKKPEVKESFINDVKSFINGIQGYTYEKITYFMMGEFADEDGPLYSELEHGSHWEKFPAYKQFSHH